MQGHSLFEHEEFDEDFDDDSLSLSFDAFSPSGRARPGLPEDSENSGDSAMGLPGQIRNLGSSPPIGFSTQLSTFGHPSSHISGSTLHPGSNPFVVAHKAFSSVPSSRMSIEDRPIGVDRR